MAAALLGPVCSWKRLAGELWLFVLEVIGADAFSPAARSAHCCGLVSSFQGSCEAESPVQFSWLLWAEGVALCSSLAGSREQQTQRDAAVRPLTAPVQWEMSRAH